MSKIRGLDVGKVTSYLCQHLGHFFIIVQVTKLPLHGLISLQSKVSEGKQELGPLQ
jgi:hypothetical protein